MIVGFPSYVCRYVVSGQFVPPAAFPEMSNLINTEHWITAISEQSPCGDDLEYDGDFLALGRAVLEKPEQQYGDTVIPAEKPDWREVERLAESLMRRTKDIRVCVFLTRALTQNHGLQGLSAGLDTIYQLLSQYWNDVHPRLMIDDYEDPFVRINAISELADISGLIRDVRHAVLIKSPLGLISVKDAEAVLENGQSESGINRSQLIAIAADSHSDTHSPLLAMGIAHHTVDQINTLCREQFGQEQSPDLLNLSGLLSRLLALQPGNTSTESNSSESAENSSDAGSSNTNHIKASGALTQINSRQDVIRVLELVCRYMEENEPTNPAPLLIKRAQRLMTLDFMSIMRDMSPDSINQIELITGVSQN